MSEVKSYRKPYNPPVTRTWFLKNPFFTRYIIREGTCLTTLFLGLEILLGVFLFALCDLRAETATAESAAPYLWYVNSFLGNPLIIILNLVALAGTAYHTYTFIPMCTKFTRFFMNKNSTELIPNSFYIIGLWGALAGATIVILGFAVLTLP